MLYPRRNILASQIVAALKNPSPELLALRNESLLPTDWRAVLHPTIRGADEVDKAVLASASPSEQAAVAAAERTALDEACADLEAYASRASESAQLAQSLPTAEAPTEPMEAPAAPTATSIEAPAAPSPMAPTAPPTEAPAVPPALLSAELAEDCEEASDDEEVDDPGGRADVHEPDQDSEGSDIGGGDFDFEFDDTGARVHRDEQLADSGLAPSPSQPAPSQLAEASKSSAELSSSVEPKAKASRAARKIRIVTKAAGSEGSDGGEERIITQKAKEPGIFTAHNYFWLYFAVYPAVGVTIVPVWQQAGPTEAHAILDPVENADADSIEHSNSTYEFAGVDATRPGLLYSKTLPCVCQVCRDPSSIALTESRCPFWATTGKWRQNTVHALVNVPLQQKKQRLDSTVFRLQMLQCPTFNSEQPEKSLFAAYADPRHIEKGGHKYWLVLCMRLPYLAPKGLKDALGKTITAGHYIVDVRWYECTSDDPNHKAYRLLEGGIVHLKMSALITEVGLEWAHYSPRLATGVLSDGSHLALMQHNYSNVASSS